MTITSIQGAVGLRPNPASKSLPGFHEFLIRREKPESHQGLVEDASSLTVNMSEMLRTSK